MPPVHEHELEIRNALAAAILQLNDMEAKVRASVGTPGADEAPNLKEIMMKVGDTLQECESIVEDHASDLLRASDDLLSVAANAIKAAREVVSAIVMKESIQGR